MPAYAGPRTACPGSYYSVTETRIPRCVHPKFLSCQESLPSWRLSVPLQPGNLSSVEKSCAVGMFTWTLIREVDARSTPKASKYTAENSAASHPWIEDPRFAPVSPLRHSLGCSSSLESISAPPCRSSCHQLSTPCRRPRSPLLGQYLRDTPPVWRQRGIDASPLLRTSVCATSADTLLLLFSGKRHACSFHSSWF
jgi:hypothetical protein